MLQELLIEGLIEGLSYQKLRMKVKTQDSGTFVIQGARMTKNDPKFSLFKQWSPTHFSPWKGLYCFYGSRMSYFRAPNSPVVEQQVILDNSYKHPKPQTRWASAELVSLFLLTRLLPYIYPTKGRAAERVSSLHWKSLPEISHKSSRSH